MDTAKDRSARSRQPADKPRCPRRLAAASGLGVPNWAVLPATLPSPG